MQMWTAARFLPLAVGNFISNYDEHWSNYLCLMEIMDFLFSKRIPQYLCGYLEAFDFRPPCVI